MKRVILFITAGLLTFTSCKKFLDVNSNPNSAIKVPSSVLLPTTTIGIGWANQNELGRATSILMQYNAGIANQNLTYDSYNISGLFDNQWNYEIFVGCVNNLQIIIKQSEQTDPAYSGIAKIQLAYIFSVLTDLWGDVPYSQAGFGLEYSSPRYDKQSDIYQGNASLGIVSLFDLVKSGIADLNKPSALKPSSDDLVYGGDLNKWKKAGNSLILKFANTISGVNPALAKSQIEGVLASTDGYITANSGSTTATATELQVPFSTAVNNMNPNYVADYYGSFKNGQMLSSRLLALSNSLNDNIRLSKFYTKPSGNFVGFDNGSNSAAPALATRSMYNNYIVGGGTAAPSATNGGDGPARLLTNFQMKFILAESAITLGTPGNANTLYQEGIRASMSKVGMTTAEIDAYFLANPTVVNLSGTDQDKIKQIITQKYLAWVGNGIEAYNDYRRTGYPVLAPAINATGDNNGNIPLRFVYTPQESNTNPNQPKPLVKTSVKVWWGK